MELIIVPQKKGLTVNFLNLSTEVPSNIVFEWDFGDGTEVTQGKTQTHTYENIGFYTVTVKTDPVIEGVELSLPLVVTDKAKTSLSDTIYRLIDNYMPSHIIKTFPFEKKRLFIEKWQLYIQPLVNHEIDLSDYNNELYYEALENQLIMEAASFDFLTVEFTNFLQSISSKVTNRDEETSEEGSDKVKRIQTGPSEVEYFNPSETDADMVINITKALQPKGFIDTLRTNLCTLATRLDIWLPFCSKTFEVVVPSVVNRREPVRFMGQNPKYPIKKGV